MAEPALSLSDLNDRSRVIFSRLVETYLETGVPVGSRTLSKSLDLGLSAASVRNVMQDLEQLGLLDSPHTSAGRVPSEQGLRLFVDGVLEIGDLPLEDRARIERAIGAKDADVAAMLDKAGALLSGLSHCASLVFAPKREAPIRHAEFVSLGGGQGLAILVTEDGAVENRVFDLPSGLTQAAIREAANFLNAHLRSRTLAEARDLVARQMAVRRAELDTLAASLVERGIALWEDATPGQPERLMVRGRGNLLEEGQNSADLDRMRMLFDDLEQKRDLADLIDLTEGGNGVRVFIGSENKLFSLSGSALVISPYTDGDRRVIGAIGVIGPTRLNYGRIVPIVDYTARLLGRLVAETAGHGTPREGP
ncbi:MAG: heat-inducible transcriptional repressor HrcA [Paracoccaceae bacterium]